ncbi:MAG: flagellar hook assembly protein FlgD [Desulfovermiculus sp.]
METSATGSIKHLMQDTGNTISSPDKDQDIMGKDDFLQLLVTQLENQDPLEPMDPEQMSAQLAQFSSLEQLTNISESMEGLESMAQGMDRTTALNLLGKSVRLEGNSFALDHEDVSLSYRLEDEADNVNVLVADSTGQQVAELSASGTSPGEHSLTWDGTNDEGEQCPPGQYSFVVEARKDDEVLETEPLVMAQVTGVDYAESGEPTLQTSAGEVPLSQIGIVRGADEE